MLTYGVSEVETYADISQRLKLMLTYGVSEVETYADI